MRIYKLFFTVCLLVSTVFSVVAQGIKVKGTVKDLDGEPIPGVNVVVLDKNERYLNGTITNMDGYYELSVKDRTNRLNFTFIGFKDQILPIKGPVVDVTLFNDMQNIDQINVVVHRRDNTDLFSIPRPDLTTSSQLINMENMDEVPSVSVEDAIQGRLANVDMVSQSGDPGSGMSIRIRGTSSLNANTEPLIVVDGMPYNTSFGSDFDFKTANTEDYGALVSIAPENIESIEVLKDGAATALYGARGANGVLVIKTKRGTAGRTTFGYSLRTSYKKEPKTIPMLSGKDYIGLMSEALWNSYLYTEGKDDSYLYIKDKYSEINGDPYYKYFNEYDVNTNWLDEINQNPLSFDHNFSMSGGGSKARYRINIGYLDELGNTKNTSFTRLSNSINLDYFLSDKITFSTDFSFTSGKKDSPLTYGNNHVRAITMRKMPNMSPYILDANGSRTDEYFQPLENWQGFGTSIYNPVAMTQESVNQVKTDRIRSIFRVQYRITNQLRYQMNVAFDKNDSKAFSYLPQSALGTNWSHGDTNVAAESYSESFAIETDNKLTYMPNFGDGHELNLMANVHTGQFINDAYSTSVNKIPSYDIREVANNGNVRNIESGSSENRLISYMVQGHYKLKDKYLIGAGVRYDGSSRFGSKARWGFFPNLSLGWNINKESFLQSTEWIDQLKLLVNYGTSGNVPTVSYGYYGSYTSYGSYMNKGALYPNRMTLNNLEREKTYQFNVGLDLFALDNRLNVTLQYYNKKTTDLLQKDAQLPSMTGFDKMLWYNAGDMVNNGFEIYGYYIPYKNKQWHFQIDYNLARNVNEITKLPENVNFTDYEYANNRFAYKHVIGDPVGSIYGYHCDGVYSTMDDTYARDKDGDIILDPNGEEVIMTNKFNQEFRAGDAKYQDINKDGVIDENDIVYLGNVNPILTGGFGPSVTYKRLSFRMFFHFRVGQKVINETRMNTENMYGVDNQSTAVLHRWRKEGDVTTVPQALYKIGFNTLGSDRFVEDGDFLRLKTLSLSYNLPTLLVQKLKMSKCKVFVTGYDLLTWSNYSGQDPEVGVDGMDRSYTPRPIRFTAGINMNF
ncbi:SusC/RagA family TonB-linked outer membrane protein [Saccharicrinis sp. GN24d3]|uniref:SusC/RagA family TonB-linked outer membrane protein n=1 Tax=Saccharicrinis sp. GN24d3 TaxID=3458416 RepID=UPI004035631A